MPHRISLRLKSWEDQLATVGHRTPAQIVLLLTEPRYGVLLQDDQDFGEGLALSPVRGDEGSFLQDDLWDPHEIQEIFAIGGVDERLAILDLRGAVPHYGVVQDGEIEDFGTNIAEVLGFLFMFEHKKNPEIPKMIEDFKMKYG